MVRQYRRVNITPEELRHLYWDENMSMAMLAKGVGIATGHINWLFDKWHIPKRNKSESLKLALKVGRAKRPLREQSSNFKTGRLITSQGYVAILQDNHPRGRIARNYVFEHILVWEKAHGRPLPEGWCVHHLNGIKSDNRAENLQGMPRKNHSVALLMKGIQLRLRKVENELRAIKSQGVFNV